MARTKNPTKPDHKTVMRRSVRIYLDDLHAPLEAMAKANDRSMSAECKRAVREYLAKSVPQQPEADNG